MSSETSTPEPGAKKVGAFDIRYVISALTGVYGVILLLLGIFHKTQHELDRGDGVNINLWVGIGLIVFTALFVLWARVRPTIVPADEVEELEK